MYFWHGLPHLGHAYAMLRAVPEQRNDMDELIRLKQDIGHRLVYDSVYILSFSEILNRDLIARMCTEYGKKALNSNLLTVSEIDKRDGFPMDFFDAKYVYLATPVMDQWQKNKHSIMSLLADSIQDQTVLGNYYEVVPDRYELDSGIKVTLFKRMRDIESSRIDNLRTIFESFKDM